MKKNLLPFLICFAFININEAQDTFPISAKKLTQYINKGMKISNTNKASHSHLRDFEYPLVDTVTILFLDTETGQYVEEIKFRFTYQEHNGQLRIDSIYAILDFSSLPIPISYIGGQVRYDTQGRFKGYNLDAVTIFGPLPLSNYLLVHDEKNRVILAKQEPSPLFGDLPFGDSIVYVDNARGYPASWTRYDIELHTEATPEFFANTNIEYDENDRMIGFVETYVSESFSFSTRYADVEFYEYDERYTQFYQAEYTEPLAEFLFSMDNDPLNRFRKFIVKGTEEQLIDDEWVLSSITNSTRSDELLRVTIEYPGDFLEIHEYTFEDGRLTTHLKSIDIMIGQVVPERRVLFIYDEKGDFVSEIGQWIDFGQWIEEDRIDYVYEYDENDLIKEFTSEYYSDGELLFGEKLILSNIEQIGTSTDNIEISSLLVKLYPNPVTLNSVVEFNNSYSAEVRLVLTNMLGHVIWSNQEYLNVGVQQIHFNAYSLQPGNYILSVQHAGGIKSIPLLKL